MWIWLVACTEPGPVDDRDPPALDAHSGPEPEPVDSTAPPTGDSGVHSAVPLECGPPPAGPFPWISSDAVHTEEDFDFDATGQLLSQRMQNLVGIQRDGTATIVATQVGYDAAGIRSLPSGEVVVAQPDSGTLVLVDLSSGGSAPVVTGLEYPNGLEVGTDGSVYVSEFLPRGRVERVDPEGRVERLASVDYPNGLVLSPDEQTLYIVSSAGLLGFGNSTIYTLARQPDGSWSEELAPFYAAPITLGGVTVDACGSVYVIGYNDGHVMRIDLPDDGVGDPTITDITTLPGGGFWSSLRFSPGMGRWPRTELYATNRRELYGVEVGVEGRHVLAP